MHNSVTPYSQLDQQAYLSSWPASGYVPNGAWRDSASESHFPTSTRDASLDFRYSPESLVPARETRPCSRYERFVVGERVAVQIGIFGFLSSTEVLRIIKGGMEFRDPFSGIPVYLPFRAFRKIISSSPAPGCSLSPVPCYSPLPVSPCSPSPAQPPFDSCASLLKEFSRRERREFRVTARGESYSVHGYFATEAQHVADQQRLLRIIEVYNAKFAHKGLPLERGKEYAGSIEEVVVPTGTEIFAGADLHSDLASLIGLFKFFSENNYTNSFCGCRPGFCGCFLGDFGDRGVNNIEVLSLLLTWKIENPSSVYLIRGNHEDVDIMKEYMLDREFLETNSVALTQCFEKMPLAIAVGTREPYIKPTGAVQYQSIHFSHALFSPAVLGESFLTGEDHSTFVEKEPVFCPKTLASEKANRAFQNLQRKFRDIPEALHSQGYMWSDVGRQSGPSERGAGYVFSPEDIHEYLQTASGGKRKICACLRGHEHVYEEHTVSRKTESNKEGDKVLVTTIPASKATGCFGPIVGQGIQGLIISMNPKVEDCRKKPILVQIDEETHLPVLSLSAEDFGFYDSLGKYFGLSTGVYQTALSDEGENVGQAGVVTDSVVSASTKPQNGATLLCKDDL